MSRRFGSPPNLHKNSPENSQGNSQGNSQASAVAPDQPMLKAPVIADPVVGRFYDVLCVWVWRNPDDTGHDPSGKGQWIPVLGPAHLDQEIAPHIPEHWHYDFRFLSDRDVKAIDLSYNGDFRRVFGRVINTRPRVWNRDLNRFESVREVRPQSINRRQCHRLMPDFPARLDYMKSSPAQNLTPRVEALCEGKRLNPQTMLCPHRGVCLKGMPVDANGHVICPGHGVKWDTKTGEMIPMLTDPVRMGDQCQLFSDPVYAEPSYTQPWRLKS